MTRSILAALAVNAALFSPALAADKCNVPVDQWQPREALQAKLEGEGWKIKSIASEAGCYEAYAIDANGKRVEAYFNPKTLEAVSVADEG